MTDLAIDNGHGKPASRRRGNVIRIAILGASEAQRNDLRESLGAVAEVNLEIVDTVGSPPAASRTEGGPLVMVIVLHGDSEMWSLQIREWTEGAANTPIIAALEERSGDAVRQALRAGANDVIFLPSDSSDLARCLVKIAETRQGSSTSGLVCSLASVAGGVGVSTVTTALGFSLMRQHGKRVALVDLSLQCGSLSALLDLDPDHTLAELIDPTSAIDSIRLESVLCAHPSGLYLLAAPKRIEESELVSASAVSSTLGVMRELFDVVLVDCGHNMSETLIAAWEQSQHLFYLVEQSVTSVRPAQRFLDLFQRLLIKGGIDLRFILNNFVEDSPFTSEKIENALKLQLFSRIPRDDKAFVELQIQGKDLAAVAPDSEASRSIDNLACYVAGKRQSPNGRPATAFLSRLRSAVGL